LQRLDYRRYPFAIQAWGVLPDIITMGKALTSGYAPLSATLAADKVVDAFARSVSGEFTHGSTHSGCDASAAEGHPHYRGYERPVVAASGASGQRSGAFPQPHATPIQWKMSAAA
jgi:adenosylmethionine-8-amino-7-oxononanoate aminotransferase